VNSGSPASKCDRQGKGQLVAALKEVNVRVGEESESPAPRIGPKATLFHEGGEYGNVSNPLKQTLRGEGGRCIGHGNLGANQRVIDKVNSAVSTGMGA
jgi:hypothetical protein